MTYGRRSAAIGKEDPAAMSVKFHFCAKFFPVSVVARPDTALGLDVDAGQRQFREGS
jgi:hypothetical protein